MFFVLPWVAYEAWVERAGSDLALLEKPWLVRACFYGWLLLMLLWFPPPVPSEFIYFQF